jgi:hypothetical protein
VTKNDVIVQKVMGNNGIWLMRSFEGWIDGFESTHHACLQTILIVVLRTAGIE